MTASDGDRPGSVPLSVIVLTYNSAATVVACLTSLHAQVVALGGELLVVDNASVDGTVARAEELGVEVRQTGANLGFAAGCNHGADLARGDLLVFVNPDAAVDDGALAALLSAAATGRTGPLGGRGRLPDGSYDPRSVLGAPSLVGALLFAFAIDKLTRGSARFDPEHGPRHLPADGSVVPVVAVSGAFLAVPRELWDRLGGFDEAYFLYGEDADLSLRARAQGWQPALVTASGYRHVGGVSSADTTFRDELLYRGKVELYRHHLGPWAARIAILALQIGTLVRGVPAPLRLRGLQGTARPWWRLFQRRGAWRRGYLDGPPGGPA